MKFSGAANSLDPAPNLFQWLADTGSVQQVETDPGAGNDRSYPMAAPVTFQTFAVRLNTLLAAGQQVVVDLYRDGVFTGIAATFNGPTIAPSQIVIPFINQLFTTGQRIGVFAQSNVLISWKVQVMIGT